MRFTRRSMFVAVGGALVGSACGGAASNPRPKPSATPARGLLIERARVPGSDGERSLYLGGSRPPTAAERARARVIDAEGGLVLPGFHDGHAHLRSAGLALDQIDLTEVTTLDAAIAAVRAWAETHARAEWILGRGWQYGIAAGHPTRQALDRAVADRPVWLESYDGHSGWANTRALALAGIDAASVDPPDGRIVRAADGSPSGALLEGAMALLDRHVPPPSEEMELAALERATQHLLGLGVTNAVDFVPDTKAFARYRTLEARGRLPIQLLVSPPLDGSLDEYERLRGEHRSGLVRFGYLKAFVDGVIESRTAYMLEPYLGASTRGEPLLAPEKLGELVGAAHRRGFPVALHAIGDAAVRLALDTLEAAIARHGPLPSGRHRIEHIEVVHPDDVPRFAKLGVVASMQPFHAVPEDVPDQGVWSQNLGPERLARAFAWRALANAGATLVFGSDWPVMSADPLWGLALATTRKNQRALPAAGWYPEHCLSVEQALAAYAGLPEPRFGGPSVVVLARHVRLDDPATLWSGERVRYVIVDGVLPTKVD